VPPAGVAVRPSGEADVPAIQAIYAHHVLHGLGTFEEVPPDAEEMARRRAATRADALPHLVAQSAAGTVAGFAYLGPLNRRSAYRYTVETSLYVAAAALRQGIGSALLAELLRAGAAAGFRQAVALIGDRANAGSIGVHRAFGFVEVGAMPAVGYKAGRWVDVVMMQRALGPGAAEPPGARPSW
jgi:phosphinothricin acetyltransferase